MTEFEINNKVSLETANQIEKYLKGWGFPSLIIIINSMSLFLKLPKQFKQLNSTLCIAQRGSGKSTLILHILAKSNPKIFQILPKKMFESLLIKNQKSFFDKKALAHDDIIVAFGGLSKKQREQLVNFFVLLLSDGTYDRQDINHLKDINCLAHFGIAKESYAKYRRELLDATFLDRFATFQVSIDRDEKIAILNHRDRLKEENNELPKIKLPYFKRPIIVKLNLTDEIKKERNRLAIELDDYNVMSFARAQNYIDLFMMSNSLFNNRKETNEQDLEIYKKVHPYHLNSCGELKQEDLVKKYITNNPDIGFKEISKRLSIAKTTFYNILKRLKERGDIE